MKKGIKSVNKLSEVLTYSLPDWHFKQALIIEANSNDSLYPFHSLLFQPKVNEKIGLDIPMHGGSKNLIFSL